MPLGTSYILKTLRLHPLENTIIDRACEALGGLERAQLMQEAVLAEAFRLGVRFSVEPPPRLTRPWPYLPDRGEEATEVRVSIEGAPRELPEGGGLRRSARGDVPILRERRRYARGDPGAARCRDAVPVPPG